uniref:RING-type E3 ubiquitin transferase n=1 Tax=Daphnia galeata TaxID=27404 RepID=A0A8J2RWL5_9CRUS|nr:unnamed protein product [Daphnia galeata]
MTRMNGMMANNDDTSITATSSSSLNYDDGQCAICLGPHVDKSHLNCGHVFCYDCLVEWCKVKLQCPTCKRPFTSILHNIGSPDGQQIYTPDSPLGLAGHSMQLFALLMLGDPEFRRRISRPEIIREVDDFQRVLSDPQLTASLSDSEFRRALEEMVCEVLDDDTFHHVLNLPDLRRSFLNDWLQQINNARVPDHDRDHYLNTTV